MIKKIKTIFLLLVFLLIAPNIYATDHTGTISSDETWALADSPHIITGNITLNAILTIEAGCEVKFNSLKYFYVYQSGRVIAEGTAVSFIEFKSNVSGDWRGFYFFDASGSHNGGSFKYCQFTDIYGGSYFFSMTAVPVSPFILSIENCIFDGVGTDSRGIYLRNGNLTVNHCVFDNFSSMALLTDYGGSQVLTAKSSIFINCSNALYRTTGTLTSRYNNFYNNTTDYHGTISDKTGDELARDPQFVGGSPYDYHLGGASPCIGDGEGGTDMGAYGTEAADGSQVIIIN